MYKVLLVEDEDLIRRGLKFRMDWTAVGCVIAGEASSGEEGLALIRAVQPDIVITDIRMPGMSGIDMLRAGMKEQTLRAIILSGHADFKHAQDAIRLGVVEYLLKPVDFDELRDCILRITAGAVEAEHEEYKKRMAGVRELPLPDPDGIRNEYARRMLDYITAHYAEKISITDLGALYDVSSTHLNAKFKAETGYTFHDFLNYYRISKAVELQKEGNHKLYEIAEMIGISDYKYFNKVYRKYVGCSPAKFFQTRAEELPAGADDVSGERKKA